MTIDIQPDEAPASRLTADEARAVTAQLQEHLGKVWELLLEAYKGRAHEVLGYDSWAEYCSAEFATDRLRLPRGERREAVAKMRDEGMSVREVAAALGVNKETVVHDGQVYGNRTNPAATAEDPEPAEDFPDEEEPDDLEGLEPAPVDRRKSLPDKAREVSTAMDRLADALDRLRDDDRYPTYSERVENILRPAARRLTDLL